MGTALAGTDVAPNQRIDEWGNRGMRVLMNATPLLSTFTGIGQYVRNLSIALRRASLTELVFFYGFGCSTELRETPVAGIEATKRAVKTLLPKSYEVKQFVQATCFRFASSRVSVDLYHEPNFLPFAFSGPVVVTVHDLSWFRYPETHPADRVRAMTQRFPSALDRSAHLLTDAESVKREIVQTFGVASERITAVPLAAREAFKPVQQEACGRTLARFEIGWRGFFLCVGTLEPRKNLELVVRAYANLPESLHDRFPLVIVGMKGWLTSRLDSLLAPLVQSGRVRPIGYVDDATLAVLYGSARMLVYPSLYEGFGLPPLEAMASGTPVIVSNVSSLPEVVGDAGIQVSPHDVDALRDAIRLLSEDDGRWEALRFAGLARAAQFSWERCARETLAVYRKVLA